MEQVISIMHIPEGYKLNGKRFTENGEPRRLTIGRNGLVWVADDRCALGYPVGIVENKE